VCGTRGRLNSMDMVWTPSSFNEQSGKQAAKRPIWAAQGKWRHGHSKPFSPRSGQPLLLETREHL
jgi:hypothetical protein